MNEILPIIYSPHSFGLKKNSLDELYFPLSVSSCLKTNPRSSVYFLQPDQSVERIFDSSLNIIQCSSIANQHDLQDLADCYLHLSTNREDFELFCISRFFYLRDFFKASSISRAIVIESDVLLFQDVSEVLSFYSKDSACLLSGSKCISLGVLTKEYLEYFCSFVLEVYRDPVRLSKLRTAHSGYLEMGGKGGICDMSFCDFINKGAYGADTQYKVENLSKVVTIQQGHKFMFDDFISRSSIEGKTVLMGRSHIDGKEIKSFYLEGSNIYISIDAEPCRLGSLHFQGTAKQLMASVYCSLFR